MVWTVQVLDERVQRELDDLPDDMQARFRHISKLIVDRGPFQVGMPYVRFVEQGLWEMRMKGRDGISRSMYAVEVGQLVLVLRVFVKKTEQTPRKEIEIALQRLKKWRDR
jgi:phage-related protein